MERRKYWKAGLITFIVSALAFMALPLPSDLSIRTQVLALLAFQGTAIALCWCLLWLRTRRDPVQFDLGKRNHPRLTLVHSRKD